MQLEAGILHINTKLTLNKNRDVGKIGRGGQTEQKYLVYQNYWQLFVQDIIGLFKVYQNLEMLHRAYFKF